MHQLGRPGRRSTRQVIHFAQENGITPAYRIARDAAAIDAASDDGEIEYPVQRNVSPAIASSLRRFHFRIGVNHKEKRKQDEREAKAAGRPGNWARPFGWAFMLRDSGAFILRDGASRLLRMRSLTFSVEENS